jgi:hypothetical protein
MSIKNLVDEPKITIIKAIVVNLLSYRVNILLLPNLISFFVLF